jgi:hypothetical protein
MVAAGILAAATAAWYLGAAGWLKWAFYKRPVPWPEGVRVHAEQFRLLSLPRSFAGGDGRERYVLVEADADDDGQADGDVILPPHLTDSLGIGTRTDRARLADRRSNWYFVREYEDTDTGARWRLEAFYYTGMLDQVPHVPERCLAAAGAALERADLRDVTFDIPAGAWRGQVPFRRAPYVPSGSASAGTRYVQYYTFSMNGRPTASWEAVRLRLTYPWVRWCYFAKIQFYPTAPAADLARADREAEAFARCFLPAVLEALPTAEDVARCSQAETPQARRRD